MKGDHIYVERSLLGIPIKAATYTHHGIDLGDGRVAHFDGEPTRIRDAAIKISTLEEFLSGGRRRVRRHNGAPFTRDQIVHRAILSVGRKNYNLAFNNCEHFATWCVTGEQKSVQVIRFGMKLAKFASSALRKFKAR